MQAAAPCAAPGAVSRERSGSAWNAAGTWEEKDLSKWALEELSAPVAKEAVTVAGRALAAAGLPPSRVDALLLAGGGCRMARVQSVCLKVCACAYLRVHVCVCICVWTCVGALACVHLSFSAGIAQHVPMHSRMRPQERELERRHTELQESSQLSS